MKMLLEAIKQAENYAEMLKFANQKLKDYFPITAKIVETLAIEELAIFELLTSRFALLQEFIGRRIFPLLLAEAIEETVSRMSHIDQLNKLEKLEIIDTTDDWREMNKVCDQIIKTYPQQATIVAVKLYIEKMTFPEMLKKLKTFSIIDDKDAWRELREIRNRIIHNYPDKLDEMAELFNDVYHMTPKLLDCLDRIRKMIKRL